MANIVTVLDEMTCPAVSGFNMGTWWQKVYTSEAEYRSRYATTLTSIQSGRAVVNSAKSKSVTVSTLCNELRTDSTTNAAAVTSLKKWFLNQSYNKARLKIGAASSAAVQVAATVVNGTINGVWYSMAGAESAFATPTDSFAPAATRVSRCFTFYYTSFATFSHSTSATVSGTASAPIVPRIPLNAFPFGVCKIVIKAGSATRFNGGTTTLGNPALTTTFIDYSCLPDYLYDHAPGVTAAALTSIASAAMSTPGASLTSGYALPSLNIDENAKTW